MQPHRGIHRLRGHRLGRSQARRVLAGLRQQQARVQRAGPSPRIGQWAQALRARFGGRPIAVCVEFSKGPFVYALQHYDFLVIYPVNPTTLSKYREAFCLSHAKDDPTDAELALEVLIKHRDRLNALHPQSPAMRTLQRLVEQHAAPWSMTRCASPIA